MLPEALAGMLRYERRSAPINKARCIENETAKRLQKSSCCCVAGSSGKIPHRTESVLIQKVSERKVIQGNAILMF